MIALTELQYAAIGHVAVESGTLEREVQEYIAHFQGAPISDKTRGLGLTAKLTMLQKLVGPTFSASVDKPDFDYVIGRLSGLVAKRDTAVHGVWSHTSNVPLSVGAVTAKSRSGSIQAEEVLLVAKELRLARKALLRLIRDHFPQLSIAKSTAKSGKVLVKSLRHQVAARRVK